MSKFKEQLLAVQKETKQIIEEERKQRLENKEKAEQRRKVALEQLEKREKELISLIEPVVKTYLNDFNQAILKGEGKYSVSPGVKGNNVNEFTPVINFLLEWTTTADFTGFSFLFGKDEADEENKTINFPIQVSFHPGNWRPVFFSPEPAYPNLMLMDNAKNVNSLEELSSYIEEKLLYIVQNENSVETDDTYYG